MPERRLVPSLLLTHARTMRHGCSTPEAVLWNLLRNRGVCGLKFRRQHPIGPFIADFFCADAQWVIEVDGGQHNTPEARDYDDRRTRYLAGAGFTVTRFWSDEVMGQLDAVVQRLEDVARARLAGKGGGTLTPALSQREREQGAVESRIHNKKE